MLLQRLVEHAETSAHVVPPFYGYKPVRWILDIDRDGKPRKNSLTDTAVKEDRETRFGTLCLVPAVTRTVGIAPALAVDNGEYVFGWESEGCKPDRVAKQHQAFRDLIAQWAEAEPDGPGPAIVAFYRDGHHRAFLQPPDGWGRGDLVRINVAGVAAAETPEAQRFWASVAGDRKGSGRNGICLVCGQMRTLLKTIPQQIARRWLPGATQGASLVSVNEAVHGYELQKFLGHTPICVDCGLKFMGALTGLLSDSKHSTALSGQNVRLAWWVIGGSTFDGWSELDDPDPAKIRRMVDGPAGGEQRRVDSLSTYCSVGVSGNVARVVVRDWVEQPVTQVQKRIKEWFDDHEMINDQDATVTPVRLQHLVRVTGRFQNARGGGSWINLGAKGEDRPEDALQSLLGAALLGRALPPRLLNHVVRRVRADRRVDHARAALIRLALRRHPHYPDREGLTPTVNTDKKQPAYVSGRIFAVMDDLQRTVFRVANQNLNTTFAERYFGRAIDNPQVVMVSGRRHTTAWLRRLRGPLRRASWAAAYERRLDDLFGRIEAIPSTAVLTDKAEFILGYHQQRAELRAERIAAAERKKQTDLPPAPDDQPTTDAEGDPA